MRYIDRTLVISNSTFIKNLHQSSSSSKSTFNIANELVQMYLTLFYHFWMTCFTRRSRMSAYYTCACRCDWKFSTSCRSPNFENVIIYVQSICLGCLNNSSHSLFKRCYSQNVRDWSYQSFKTEHKVAWLSRFYILSCEFMHHVFHSAI